MELREVQQFNPQNQAGGKCTFCQQHQRIVPNVVPERRARIFSTGLFIDFEGVIEICEICLRNAVGVLGFVTPEQYAEVRTQLDEADEQVSELDDLAESRSLTIASLSRELADAAEKQGAKVAAAYDHGWQDAMNQANVPEVPEPDFEGGGD